MTFQEFAAKKVLGVPVLYLGAAAVTILLIVAWRLKATPDDSDGAVSADDATVGTDEGSTAGQLAGMDGSPYEGFTTNGTVVVQPQTPVATDTEPVIKDNDDWVRAGAEWLVAQKKASGSTAATALTKYVDGENLSFDEGNLVNLAIEEKGQPPDPLGKIGTIGTAPAQKQFNNYPGTHTVKGTNDNTPTKLAALYYGNSDSLHTNKIASANLAYGPVSTTYNVGTKITIPLYTNPRYYTITKTTTWPSQVAAKNGLSYNQFLALNPGLTAPYKVGSKVRVF